MESSNHDTQGTMSCSEVMDFSPFAGKIIKNTFLGERTQSQVFWEEGCKACPAKGFQGRHRPGEGGGQGCTSKQACAV